MSNRTLKTPQELTDFLIGKEIFNRGGYINDCTSEAMRQGFSRMANQHIDKTFVSWKTFKAEPKQVVFILNS